MKTRFFPLTAATLAFAALLAKPTQSAEPPVSPETLHTKKVAPEDYQSFVKNWDNKAHPNLLAAIQTPAQWNVVMGPAAVMGKHPPFAPKDGEFAKNQLLIAARVMPGPVADFGKCYKVDSATLKDGELTLAYEFIAPSKPGSFTVKNYLGVWVPKRPVKKIVFVENGKRIGTLDLAGGQWCAPKL